MAKIATAYHGLDLVRFLHTRDLISCNSTTTTALYSCAQYWEMRVSVDVHELYMLSTYQSLYIYMDISSLFLCHFIYGIP